MVIYPFAYIVLSLPLAAGRMMAARGITPSTSYFCVAGAMMTSSGFVDVLLYTLTRRSLILNSDTSAHQQYANMGSQSNSKGRIGRLISGNKDGVITTMTTTITSRLDKTGEDRGVIGGKFRRGLGITERQTRYSSDSHEGDDNNSTDHIMQQDIELANLGKVYQQTTIEVTSEPASFRPRKDSGNPDEPRAW